MCLSKITKELKPDNKWRVGYKLFVISENRIANFLYDSPGNFPKEIYKKNKIYKAHHIRMGKLDYVSGFHIFLKGADAMKYRQYFGFGSEKVLKINYRQARILGEQEIRYETVAPCIVADEMKIIGRVK
jgi:hypothetical protein